MIDFVREAAAPAMLAVLSLIAAYFAVTARARYRAGLEASRREIAEKRHAAI